MATSDRNIRQLFLQEKPCRILLAAYRAKKPYVSTLMKEAGTTFAHTTNILSEMESMGLVAFESSGRTKLIRLTDNGKTIAKSMKQLDGILGGKPLAARIERVQKSLDALEQDMRQGEQSEMSHEARVKRFWKLYDRGRNLIEDAAPYRSKELERPVSMLKERLEYLMTRFAVAQND